MVRERTVRNFRLYLFVILTVICCFGVAWGRSFGYMPLLLINDSSPPFAELVINDVDVDDGSATLTIKGVNFDNGHQPIVGLDGAVLSLVSYTANEIIATLPVLSATEDFSITVQTGVELENYDFYLVLQDDEDPIDVVGQLVIFSTELDDDGNMTIRGQNFDNGSWPPVVKVNSIPLVVDETASDKENLSLTMSDPVIALITEPTDGVVLTVFTGTTFEQYDAHELVDTYDFINGGEPPSGTEVDCSSRDKIPSSGEHWCTTAGQTLKWTTGPLRIGKIPHYYELAEDYEIDIAPYFVDYKDLPNRRSDSKKKEIFNMLTGLLDEMSQCSDFSTRSNDIKWDHLSFVDGKMRVKKGYRWDGESRPGRTLGYHMRAAFIHDTFYDLIRLKYIPCTDFTKDRRKKYQHLGDTVFYFLAREAGQGGVGARSAWRVLRLFGWSKAKLDIEETKFVFTGKKSAAWRFKTVADSKVWGTDTPMLIDDDGNKSVEMVCALQDEEITFDASNSRPLAEIPKKGKYQDNVHETAWRWLLNGLPLAPMKQNYVGQQIDRNGLKMTVTVGEILQKGLVSGEWGEAILKIDAGKDTGSGYFENDDAVAIKVEIDDEPPVISGITDPIDMWPPNHKYVTFYISDFVVEVTDNCSTITLDDLVITEVTSNEPDDGLGDGHTTDDFIIAPNGKSVDLRIERQGMGDGRIYTVYITAADEAGNTATAPFMVHIPHDKGQ